MPDPKPFLKWAGGKRRLFPAIRANLPEGWEEMIYYEPFLGGGAVLLDLKPRLACVSDRNPELINAFVTVRFQVDQLAECLEEFQDDLSEERYYEVRDMDRRDDYGKLPPHVRAARFIYLNRTCFNGLYRVNSKGHFNVPWGRDVDPDFPSESLLRAVSACLAKDDRTSFGCDDFANALKYVGNHTFVYLDPPYDGCFSKYQAEGFGPNDHVRLRDICRKLNGRGSKWLQSNSDTPRIRELYRDFNIVEVQAPRSISCKADGRKPIRELLIRNY